MKKLAIYKLVASVIVLSIIILALPSKAMAAQSGDFTYEVNENGSTVTITGYLGSGGAGRYRRILGERSSLAFAIMHLADARQ